MTEEITTIQLIIAHQADNFFFTNAFFKSAHLVSANAHGNAIFANDWGVLTTSTDALPTFLALRTHVNTPFATANIWERQIGSVKGSHFVRHLDLKFKKRFISIL